LTIREAEDLFALWLKASGVAAVIVRPDRYIFGGAENAAELNGLVRELANRLARPA
jgi:3-(3-hydroxy-phenyl)propionate hydroxylase